MDIMTVIAIAVFANGLGFYLGVKYNQRVMAPLFRLTSKNIHDLAHREGVSDGYAKAQKERRKEDPDSIYRDQLDFLEGQSWGIYMARGTATPEALMDLYLDTEQQIRNLRSEREEEMNKKS